MDILTLLLSQKGPKRNLGSWKKKTFHQKDISEANSDKKIRFRAELYGFHVEAELVAGSIVFWLFTNYKIESTNYVSGS